MIDKKELRKALIVHDITVPMIAEAADVSESTVYRWLKYPEKLNIGTIELLKDLAHLNREEFTRIFYPETVA
ncbi:MAG: helix-turn-helix domain-containing protein [Clostridia bacterium]|nr:helix-turn-helix domain-containing protein [Clostridia bacterium]